MEGQWTLAGNSQLKIEMANTQKCSTSLGIKKILTQKNTISTHYLKGYSFQDHFYGILQKYHSVTDCKLFLYPHVLVTVAA